MYGCVCVEHNLKARAARNSLYVFLPPFPTLQQVYEIVAAAVFCTIFFLPASVEKISEME